MNEPQRLTTQVQVSTDMLEFLGKKKDDLVSRVEVALGILKYIKVHGLNAPNDRRTVIPDEKLGKILGTRDQISYSNIQSCIQRYFVPCNGDYMTCICLKCVEVRSRKHFIDSWANLRYMNYVNFFEENEYGDTPLLVAARNRDLNTVNLLLEMGSDPNHINKLGQKAF